MKILSLFVLLLEANRCFGWEPAPASEPTNAWNMKCSAKFKELGITTSFARPTAHILHRLSVEDVKFFFNVDIPAENGIPTQNQNLNAPEDEWVLDNAPSRPTGSLSYGYHAFSVTMDNIHNKDWDIRGNTLEKLLHSFHLQELLKKASDSTNRWHDVPDDACACAMDTKGNGIIKELKLKFEFLKDGFNSPEFNSKNGIPELTDHSSWLVWKDWKKPGGFHNAKYMVFQGWDDADAFTNAGLYMHCALKKFKLWQRRI